MDDLSRFCCPNPDCPHYNQRGSDTIRVRARYGRDRQRRLLWCLACRTRFAQTRGTPLFDCRLPQGKAVWILEHLQDGCGQRQTARLTRCARTTVARLGRLAGAHAARAHDDLVGFSPLHPQAAAR
jgi:hypothetical protein